MPSASWGQACQDRFLTPKKVGWLRMAEASAADPLLLKSQPAEFNFWTHESHESSLMPTEGSIFELFYGFYGIICTSAL